MDYQEASYLVLKDQRDYQEVSYLVLKAQWDYQVVSYLVLKAQQDYQVVSYCGKVVSGSRSLLPPRWFSLPTSTFRTSSASKKEDLRKQQSIIL
ncbi:UNVERIFIED_CONTAM: hypothetical protein FKN15_007968 [Acipenser sinensis]